MPEKPSKPAQSEVYVVELTKQSYEAIKHESLKTVHPLLKPHLQNALMLLTKISPEDVIDGIETGRTLKAEIKRRFALKVKVAAASGALKYLPAWRAEVEKHLNMEKVRITLRFENPLAWEVVQAYGKDGEAWLQANIDDIKVALLEPKKR